MVQTLDPVIFATLANRLDGIVREAMQVCLQSARSSVIQARDLSASICDSKVRLVSIAQGVPIHVLTSNMSIAPILEFFDDIAPGDCFINNTPFLGCAHHADYSFCTPVFHGDKIMFWVMLRAHQADTGAPLPTVYLPFAKDVYEEGIHWPCVRVQRDYKDLADVVRDRHGQHSGARAVLRRFRCRRRCHPYRRAKASGPHREIWTRDRGAVRG